MLKTIAIACMALSALTALALIVLEVIALKKWLDIRKTKQHIKLFSEKQRKAFLIVFAAFVLLGFADVAVLMNIGSLQNPQELEWFSFAMLRLPFGLVELLGFLVLIKLR